MTVTVADIQLERRIGRNAVATFFLAFLVVSGVSQLITDERPDSINAVLEPWMQAVWAAFLIIGPLVTLTGIYWRRPLQGLTLESVGLLTVAMGLWGYALVLLAYAGTGGLFIEFLSFALGLGCLSRRRSIIRLLRGVPAPEPG
jgi:hypothetical protein